MNASRSRRRVRLPVGLLDCKCRPGPSRRRCARASRAGRAKSPSSAGQQRPRFLRAWRKTRSTRTSAARRSTGGAIRRRRRPRCAGFRRTLQPSTTRSGGRPWKRAIRSRSALDFHIRITVCRGSRSVAHRGDDRGRGPTRILVPVEPNGFASHGRAKRRFGERRDGGRGGGRRSNSSKKMSARNGHRCHRMISATFTAAADGSHKWTGCSDRRWAPYR